MAPLHCSLGEKGRLCLKKQSKVHAALRADAGHKGERPQGEAQASVCPLAAGMQIPHFPHPHQDTKEGTTQNPGCQIDTETSIQETRLRAATPASRSTEPRPPSAARVCMVRTPHPGRATPTPHLQPLQSQVTPAGPGRAAVCGAFRAGSDRW